MLFSLQFEAKFIPFSIDTNDATAYSKTPVLAR